MGQPLAPSAVPPAATCPLVDGIRTTMEAATRSAQKELSRLVQILCTATMEGTKPPAARQAPKACVYIQRASGVSILIAMILRVVPSATLRKAQILVCLLLALVVARAILILERG